MATPAFFTWAGGLSIEELQDLRGTHRVMNHVGETTRPVLGLIVMYGDWISPMPNDSMLADILQSWLHTTVNGLNCRLICGKVRLTCELVDALAEPPPAELPALAVCSQRLGEIRTKIDYLDFPAYKLQRALNLPHNADGTSTLLVKEAIQTAVKKVDAIMRLPSSISKSDGAVRIFVAGDRSSVGKSSVCLGILGNFLAMGFSPSQLGYIKPATQSESKQLIQTYCEAKGIACIPVGPLVYYRGFTRAFLAGETSSTEELLAQCGAAVDSLAQDKQVVLMDGVGFPAVGSICGTDNPAVALACSYPVPEGRRKPTSVLLVGGSGVGSAVDAFNLNASYFERAGLPVIGAVFNKLSTDKESFYSLEKCREQVTKYFEQNESLRLQDCRPFGFCPMFEKLKSPETPETLAYADEWVRIFGTHVDIQGILRAAKRVKDSPASGNDDSERPRKFPKIERPQSRNRRVVMPRREIEEAAILRGAPISA
jgi:hypothetical protein